MHWNIQEYVERIHVHVFIVVTITLTVYATDHDWRSSLTLTAAVNNNMLRLPTVV